MRVLVLDGNENQAVTCVRSLARAGHRVYVGADSPWSKAGWSRHASGTFRYPAPQYDGEAFVRRVAAETAREPGTLVLPMTERTTLPLSARRSWVGDVGGRIVLPEHKVVLQAFDKQHTTRLAESLGIAVPRTWLIESRRDAEDCASAVAYPCVLKPRMSEEISVQGGMVGTKTTGAPRYARSAEELLAAYGVLRHNCSAMLAQEFVEGQGVGYFALMRRGEPRAEFAHRRIRDVRPTGSGSAVRESVTPDPRLRDAAVAILRALEWHGVAMVEFRVRPEGTHVFLEVNGRFWNSLPLAVHAGADFPAMLADLAEAGDVERARPYRVGVRCRWLLGDFRHLLGVWRGLPAAYPGRSPGRIRALVEFLTPVRGMRHDNFTVRDPLPELGDWVHFALHTVPSGIRRLGRGAAHQIPSS